MYRGFSVTTANEVRRGKLGILITWMLSMERRKAPSYGTPAKHIITHHDHEIRIEELHIQIVLSGQHSVIESKSRDPHETRTGTGFQSHLRSASRVVRDVTSNTVIASPAHLETPRRSKGAERKRLDEWIVLLSGRSTYNCQCGAWKTSASARLEG